MVRPAGRVVASMIVTVSVALFDPAIVGAVDGAPDVDAIPEHVAAIYDYAAATAPCPISFATLAGVGAVTSDHTRVGGESRLLPDGESQPTIVYQQLAPTAPTGLLPDTDGGAIDGSADADTTVGPMQFLPATWVDFGVDGNGDGAADPENLWDAAAATANRLCAAAVDTDLPAALTAYFGTDEYNEWVLESIAAAAAWQLDLRPAPERRDPEVVTIEAGSGAASPTGALVDPEPSAVDPTVASAPATSPSTDPAEAIRVAGVEQLPSSPPAPSFIGPPAPSPSADVPLVAPGQTTVMGDWDGDGAPGTATLTVDGARATIRRTDAVDRPYGRAIDVSSELLADPQSLGGLVVGEWDGDGIDDLALLVADAEGLTAIRFDRAGTIIDATDLGQLSIDDIVVVGPVPRAALSLGGEEPWKTVTAFDGTVLDLWKVGGIIIDVSLVEQTSAMLASAAADGITLQGWGWRSHEAQIELRRAHCADIWTTPASACSPPTAIPGSSRHEFGTAIDFYSDTQSLSASSPAFVWLVENAEQFGYFNLPSEPWHWSVDGG